MCDKVCQNCPDGGIGDAYMKWAKEQLELTDADFGLDNLAAQEAVAWLIEGYGATDNEKFAKVYGEKQNKVVTPLYAHPPQPSETVAEAAIRALAECIRDMEAAGINSPASAHAALRALKGSE